MANDTNDFENIEIPTKGGSYMKLNQPENIFRILEKPVTGWIGWKTWADGTRRPVRKHVDETIAMSEVDDDGADVKYFWAMKVWNYQEEQIQILELTQKTIQKAIKALAKDKDWGSPLNYDIKVSKTGEKMETRYTVQPKPAKALNPDIEQLAKDTSVNLEALFTNADPFKTDAIDPETVPDFDPTK